MSNWPSTKAKRVYAALLRIGWSPKKMKPGSHIQFSVPATVISPGHGTIPTNYGLALCDESHTGLTPDDL